LLGDLNKEAGSLISDGLGNSLGGNGFAIFVLNNLSGGDSFGGLNNKAFFNNLSDDGLCLLDNDAFLYNGLNDGSLNLGDLTVFNAGLNSHFGDLGDFTVNYNLGGGGLNNCLDFTIGVDLLLNDGGLDGDNTIIKLDLLNLVLNDDSLSGSLR